MPNEGHVYTRPTRLALNHWALEGNWTAHERGVA